MTATAFALLVPAAPPAAAQPGEAVWSLGLVGGLNYTPGLSTASLNQSSEGSASGVAAVEGATAPAPVNGQVAAGTAMCTYQGASTSPESIVLGQGRLSGTCALATTSVTLSPLCLGCGYNVTVNFSATTTRVGMELALVGTCVAIAGGVTGTGTLVGALQLAPSTTGVPLRNFLVAGSLTCAYARAS